MSNIADFCDLCVVICSRLASQVESPAMTQRLHRPRAALFAFPVALLLALLLSGQASAILYTHQTGLVGPWMWSDSSVTPGVLCKYAATTDGNHYSMTKIVVQPPTVEAADRNSSKIDKRTVSWQFQLQRKLVPDGTWKVIASSAKQTGTATENTSPLFTAITLKHVPKEVNNPAWIVRVQVLIKWYKPTGGVEGTILFRPSYYRITSPDFTLVGSQPYCQEVETNG
jgi:hypothetical protein